MNKDTRMFMNYRRLRHIRRCNTFPTINSTDVAQHSYYVAMLAMALADEYNTWVDLNDCDLRPVSTEKVLRKALLHDTEEAITSDIPWSIKHMNSEINCALSKALKERMDKAYEGTETMMLYNHLCSLCKEGAEGEFVDIADMMELGIYCWEEYVLGNSGIKELLDKCVRLIEGKKLSGVLPKTSPLFNSLMEVLKNPDKKVMEELYDID